MKLLSKIFYLTTIYIFNLFITITAIELYGPNIETHRYFYLIGWFIAFFLPAINIMIRPQNKKSVLYSLMSITLLLLVQLVTIYTNLDSRNLDRIIVGEQGLPGLLLTTTYLIIGYAYYTQLNFSKLASDRSSASVSL